MSRLFITSLFLSTSYSLRSTDSLLSDAGSIKSDLPIIKPKHPVRPLQRTKSKLSLSDSTEFRRPRPESQQSRSALLESQDSRSRLFHSQDALCRLFKLQESCSLNLSSFNSKPTSTWGQLNARTSRLGSLSSQRSTPSTLESTSSHSNTFDSEFSSFYSRGSKLISSYSRDFKEASSYSNDTKFSSFGSRDSKISICSLSVDSQCSLDTMDSKRNLLESTHTTPLHHSEDIVIETQIDESDQKDAAVAVDTSDSITRTVGVSDSRHLNSIALSSCAGSVVESASFVTQSGIHKPTVEDLRASKAKLRPMEKSREEGSRGSVGECSEQLVGLRNALADTSTPLSRCIPPWRSRSFTHFTGRPETDKRLSVRQKTDSQQSFPESARDADTHGTNANNAHWGNR